MVSVFLPLNKCIDYQYVFCSFSLCKPIILKNSELDSDIDALLFISYFQNKYQSVEYTLPFLHDYALKFYTQK